MTELCFNFWYYLQGFQIVAIAAREYYLEGSAKEKEQTLLHLSKQDFHLVRPRKINPPDGIHYSAPKTLGVDVVFQPEIDRIMLNLPENTYVDEDLLFNATPLYDFGDGDGYVPALIGDGFIKEGDL